MNPTRYTCKECKAPATVRDGRVLRTCNHEEAGIDAHIQAAAYGKGGVRSKSFYEMFKDLLVKAKTA